MVRFHRNLYRRSPGRPQPSQREYVSKVDGDVSVVTMLREISARTEPLSVVAMTAQRQVNATTKKQEVAVTA